MDPTLATIINTLKAYRQRCIMNSNYGIDNGT